MATSGLTYSEAKSMILGAEPSSITLTNLVTDFEIEPRPATNILSLELLIEELEERLILDASDEKLEVAKNFKALHKIVNCLGIKGPLGLVGKAAEERTIEVVIHECTRVWNDHQVKDLLKNLGRVCTRYLIPPLGDPSIQEESVRESLRIPSDAIDQWFRDPAIQFCRERILRAGLRYFLRNIHEKGFGSIDLRRYVADLVANGVFFVFPHNRLRRMILEHS